MDASQLVAALAPLPRLFEEQQTLARKGPAEGSMAISDAHIAERHRIWTLANQAWLNGTEHVNTWRLLLVGAKFQPAAAHYTLLRGALEGLVTCRWLIDGRVSASERIARACAFRLEDLRQRKNLEHELPDLPAPISPGKTAHERIAELRRSMAANGIVEVGFPSAVDRFDTHGDGAWAYRILSAYAHSFEPPC